MLVDCVATGNGAGVEAGKKVGAEVVDWTDVEIGGRVGACAIDWADVETVDRAGDGACETVADRAVDGDCVTVGDRAGVWGTSRVAAAIPLEA